MASETGVRQQFFYEQLGAPSLLYREKGSYTTLDEEPNPSTGRAAIDDRHLRLIRSRAQWDQPVPQDILRSSLTHNAKNTPALHAFPTAGAKIRRQAQKTDRVSLATQAESCRYIPDGLNCVDPAYLAPFDAETLKEGMTPFQDHVAAAGVKRRADEDAPAIPWGDCNAPEQYGNCIALMPCACCNCKDNEDHTWALLHPVGPLLDRVRLSHVSLPRGRFILEDLPLPPCRRDLNVDDRVRQIAQCGPNLFVARTSINCTGFSIQESPRLETCDDTTKCLGKKFYLQQSFQIDERFTTETPRSYRPLDLCSHPKYGVVTNSLLAIVYESEQNKRSTVHRLSVDSEAVTHKTEHNIANLDRIANIDFGAQSPMVLWSAARSYVRPSPTISAGNPKPRVGHGNSLYSIDLRTNEGTFQWSPSAELYVVEGTHSISGIKTDWVNGTSVWAASVSAGKTWEIDVRMPCQTVTTWSLPHACEGSNSTVSTSGVYGEGFLFEQPVKGYGYDDDYVAPQTLLGVGKNPNSYGIHIYQRPALGPLFQSQSIEAPACPGITFLQNSSVATSSSFALPDVSSNIFTCGIASFRTPGEQLLENSDFNKTTYASNALCIVSSTNKGDVYTHTLIESKNTNKHGRPFKGLPIGSVAVPVTSIDSQIYSSPDVLFWHLRNKSPLAGHAIVGPAFTEKDRTKKIRKKLDCKSKDNASMSFETDVVAIKPTSEPLFLTADKREAATVKLPSHLASKAAGMLTTTLKCFDTERTSKVERSVEGQLLHSDINANVFRTISTAWELGCTSDEFEHSDTSSI